MMTRRRFLRVSSGVMATAGLSGGATLLAQSRVQDEASPVGRGRRRWQKSVVVRVQSDYVADAPRIRPRVMAEMFESALKSLTRANTVAKAWRQFLGTEDIVGLKFNPYGQRELGISIPFATMLLNSLIESGWSADQIVLAGVREEVAQEFKTLPAKLGWTAKSVDFGSGRDQLAAFVEQVTAIVNVPFLKDDNITGISGCLKNITYHLVKHPARFHANGGSPYLADIFALPEISGKLRLNIMNALRSVYHRGPLIDPDYVDNTGLLLMGQDPVAVDALALEVLNSVRTQAGLQPIGPDARHVPMLSDAASKGLGHIDFRKIERRLAPGY